MDLISGFGAVPKPVLYTAAPFVLVAILLTAVRLYTMLAFRRSLKQFDEPHSIGKVIVTPPQIPYTLPFLGNTVGFREPGFLTKSPGAFWENLFKWYPRSTGVCTLLLGGRKTHILFSPAAVQALFRAKGPSRDVFEHDLYSNVFQLSPEQILNVEAGKWHEHELNSRYLIKHERVNELTAEFIRVFDDVSRKDANEFVGRREFGLYGWLRDRMVSTPCHDIISST
jgi:hypothetical protein